MVKKSPYLPIEALRREIEDNPDQYQPDWASEQDAFEIQRLAENCNVPEVAKEIIKRKLANGKPRTIAYILSFVGRFTAPEIRKMLDEIGAVQVDGDVERWQLLVES